MRTDDSPAPDPVTAAVPTATPATVAVTGVTGYVGGRLVPELLEAGYTVRALTRNPDRLAGRRWADDVEAVRADVSDLDATRQALDGVDVAYYLVHSLGTGRTFEVRDRRNALTFARAAREAGVGRIVYLGGLYPDVPEGELSPHLSSRKEVEEILLASGVPTTVLRAAVILGSGSASFEMMRYLTERLPAMTTPRWVDNRIQPIAIRDVLRYLVGAAAMPADVSRGFDIGGPEIVTYREMMQRYAEVAGLPRRLIVGVPVLTPRLSSHWVGVVTPVPSGIARPLVESLQHEVVCLEDDIRQYVPDPPHGRLDVTRALELALTRIHDGEVTTRWTSASVPGAPSDPLPTDPDWAGGSLYVDERSTVVEAPSEVLWQVIEEIGGQDGWYSWSLAWRMRGLLDRIVGGPGLRRGRRDEHRLRVDDALDFWRVEALEPGRRLLLRAEMRLPGLAWLELRVDESAAEMTDEDTTGPAPEEADGPHRTYFAQRALFYPHGLLGQAYWWSVAPFHGIVFGGMQRNVARAAEQRAAKQRDADAGA
ncbi:DUF2867 domain-containing protein [Isoptericola sediminis]|uniref:SDR family oxidoreductase n=1 Tax=Isoptericola sediminis TaxID=2733572 RepID=A0A849JXM9_9MICO|nr:SDR family oxidoreductase [Isoptericola sediminis]